MGEGWGGEGRGGGKGYGLARGGEGRTGEGRAGGGVGVGGQGRGRGGEEMREAREFIFKSYFVTEVIIKFKSSIFVMELNIIAVSEEIIGSQA